MQQWNLSSLYDGIACVSNLRGKHIWGMRKRYPWTGAELVRVCTCCDDGLLCTWYFTHAVLVYQTELLSLLLLVDVTCKCYAQYVANYVTFCLSATACREDHRVCMRYDGSIDANVRPFCMRTVTKMFSRWQKTRRRFVLITEIFLRIFRLVPGQNRDINSVSEWGYLLCPYG